MIVRFNSTPEFIEEMNKDAVAGEIARKIIRVTALYKPTKMSPNIHMAHHISTYKNTAGEIVKLEKYCGDIWDNGEDENDKKTQAILKNNQDKVENAAKTVGLEIRTGIYENHEK